MAPPRKFESNQDIQSLDDSDALPVRDRSFRFQNLFGVVNLVGDLPDDEEVISSSETGKKVFSPALVDNKILACSTPISRGADEFSRFSKVGAQYAKQTQLLRETLKAAQQMKQDFFHLPPRTQVTLKNHEDEQIEMVDDIPTRDSIFAPGARKRAGQVRQEKRDREATEQWNNSRDHYIVCLILTTIVFKLMTFATPLNFYWFMGAFHVVYFAISFFSNRSVRFYAVTFLIFSILFYIETQFFLVSKLI